MLKKKNRDLLNEAHTLGLGALTTFEKAADDLEQAASLARQHERELLEGIRSMEAELVSATQASGKYQRAADNIRGLVKA